MPQNCQNRLNEVDVCEILIGCGFLIGNLIFFQVLLEFFNVLQEKGIFYFCVKVLFSLYICYYFGNDLDVRKSCKNLLK